MRVKIALMQFISNIQKMRAKGISFFSVYSSSMSSKCSMNLFFKNWKWRGLLDVFAKMARFMVSIKVFNLPCIYCAFLIYEERNFFFLLKQRILHFDEEVLRFLIRGQLGFTKGIFHRKEHFEKWERAHNPKENK